MLKMIIRLHAWLVHRAKYHALGHEGHITLHLQATQRFLYNSNSMCAWKAELKSTSQNYTHSPVAFV